jgi:outer membrane receptor protein involved in Fe transport
MRRLAEFLFCLPAVRFLCGPAFGQQPAPGEDLTSMNIEDLMNIKVTSASKKEQKLSRTAIAVFVITPKDIRRSGATNIPDLLRMVPGMNVAQINGSTCANSARGFNQQFSNKLLVMIDGRVVYTPAFAGVFWDTILDFPLEEIARIEVIRGPGGTVWGANAEVSQLDHQGPSSNVTIPSYTRLDVGLTWNPLERTSFSLVGQNLLQDHHLEFEDVNGALQSSQIRRSGFVKVTWRF